MGDWFLFETFLNMICICNCFHVDITFYFKEKSCKLNKNAKNSFFNVKIGLWILTTNFTKAAFISN